MKKYLVLLFTFAFILPTTTYAQLNKTSCVVTKVGDPSGTPPSLAECSESIGNSDILGWTTQISTHLQPGTWEYYNRMVGTVTNGSHTAIKREGRVVGTGPDGLYWCTNLVIDSYKLAGIDGLGFDHQAVVSMRSFWKKEAINGSVYIYLDYEGNKTQAMQSLLPGHAIFFETSAGVHTGKEHVAIIKSKNIDERGNGQIETYDANSIKKVIRYVVDNWTIKNAPFPVRGFGGSRI